MATQAEIWETIEKEAASIVEKSSEPLSKEQGVARLLKTERGRELYAAYSLGAPLPSLQALATEELSIRAARIAKAGVAAEDAVAHAIARYPELARRADGFRSPASTQQVAKSDGGDAWAKIEALAAGLVVKSGDLSQNAAINQVLKSAEGRELYAQYIAERAGS